MPRSKYQYLILALEILLLIAGAAMLFGVLFFVLEDPKISTWPWLLTAVFLIAVGAILLYNRRSNQRLNKLATTFRFERALYREALLFNCDYAYTVNLSRNTVNAVHRVGMLQPYNFRPDCRYDDAIVGAMAGLAPRILHGDKDIYLAHHYLDAYTEGKRVLYQEYYLKQEDAYKQKTVFLTKNNGTGELFAFIVLHDITEKTRTKEQTKASLLELTDVAKQIASGDLDVKINCSAEGDVGVLAKSLQNTADKLRIYINSIQNMAIKDSLTTMDNRTAYVGEVAEIDVRLKRKAPFSFAVVMFDLDGLKRVNDVYGHSEGDKYIVNAASLICSAFPADKHFRIGGDEFVVILFNKTLSDIERLSDEFEAQICAHNENADVKISISHGYAIYNPQKDKAFSDVYARADAEMYACKKRKHMNK